MQNSLPVICLDRGGPGLSVNSNCGKLVVCGNRKETIKNLVEAVNFYLDYPEKLSEHGSNGSKRINDVYCWDQKVEIMVSLYKQIIAGKID